MTQNQRLGVVGAGYMGKIHAGHYAAHPLVDVTGIVDINEKSAKILADKLGCTAYTTPEQLIGKVNAVTIAVPSSEHRCVAEPLLEAGIHVLMEKPLAATVEDAEAIVELAKKNSVILLVGHQERFNAAVTEFLDRRNDEELQFIEAHRLGPYVGRGGDVDIITDLMIHDIDLVLAFVGLRQPTVSALGTSSVTSHVDSVHANLEFENGTVATITASRVAPKKIRKFEIYTNKRYYILDLLDQTVTVTATRNESNKRKLRVVTQKSIEIKRKETLQSEIAHFVDVLQNGVQPKVNGEDGLSALRVAQNIREAVSQNNE